MRNTINRKINLITTIKPIIINKPEYKFETVLFLPPNPERRTEGGLRTKGFFKHSYKKGEDGVWYICDTEGNPVKPAPDEVQKKIQEYLNNFSSAGDIKELPLITVITVVLNGEKYLEQTIQSVINQTYPNVEYIFIDGGSIDGTLDIIKKYEDYIDYWVSEPDKGIYDAMNKGIDLATGEWINFMNAGDRFYDENVLKDIFLSDLNWYKTLIIVGNHAVAYDNFIKKYKINKRNILNFYEGMPFSHQSSFIKSKYHKENKYNLKFSIASDFNFFYNFYINNSDKLYVINRIISLMSAGGISDVQKIKSIKERWKVVGNKNLKINIFYIKLIFITYFKEIVKKIIGKRFTNVIREKLS